MKLKSMSEKIIEEMIKEGRVKQINIEFSSEFYDALERIHNESKRLQALSWLHSKDVILD